MHLYFFILKPLAQFLFDWDFNCASQLFSSEESVPSLDSEVGLSSFEESPSSPILESDSSSEILEPERPHWNVEWKLVAHNGRRNPYSKHAVPIVELRSERKRKSRTLLYLRAKNLPANCNLKVQVLSKRVDGGVVGPLFLKDGTTTLNSKDILEVVVPMDIIYLLDQHRVTNSRAPENLLKLSITVSLGDRSQTFLVPFYREKRLTKKRKLESLRDDEDELEDSDNEEW